MTRRNRRMKLSGTSAYDLAPFRGSIRIPTHSGLDERTVPHNLITTYVGTPASGSELRDYVDTSQVTSALDWASFAAVWSEARVKAIRVDYEPFYNGNYTTALFQSAGAVANTHVPLSAPPINMGDVVQHVTWKACRTSGRWSCEWRARGVEENSFTSTTGSQPNHGGILWYFPDLTTGEDYGRYYITYLVEFRGRR